MKGIRYAAAALLLAVLLTTLCGCGEKVGEAGVGISGTVAEHGEYIYYINGIGIVPEEEFRYEVISGSLCRMKKDGTDREVVVPMCVAAFQLIGEQIYIVSPIGDGEYEIGLCSADGKSYTKLDTMTSGVFQYWDGYLYYTRSEGLVRADSRCGSKRVLQEDSITSTEFEGDMLFYTTANGLFKMDRNTLEITQMYAKGEAHIMGCAAGRVFAVTSDDNALRAFDMQTNAAEVMVFSQYDEYIISQDGKTAYCAGGSETGSIRACNMETGYSDTLTDDFASNLLLNGEYIYYTNKSDNNFLYRVKLGGGTELVSATVPLSGSLTAIGEWLYYVSPNEKNAIYRIHTETLERECISYND